MKHGRQILAHSVHVLCERDFEFVEQRREAVVTVLSHGDLGLGHGDGVVRVVGRRGEAPPLNFDLQPVLLFDADG